MPPCARCVRANEGMRPGFAAGAGFRIHLNTLDRNPGCTATCMQPTALCPRAHTLFQTPTPAAGPTDIARDTVHGAHLRNAPFIDTADPYKSRHRHQHERPAVLRASALALRRLSSRTQPAPVCAHTQRRKNAKHRAHRPPADFAWPDCAQLPPFLERLRPASDGRVPHRPAGMWAMVETATLRPRKAPRAGRLSSDFLTKVRCSLTFKTSGLRAWVFIDGRLLADE